MPKLHTRTTVEKSIGLRRWELSTHRAGYFIELSAAYNAPDSPLYGVTDHAEAERRLLSVLAKLTPDAATC